MVEANARQFMASPPPLVVGVAEPPVLGPSREAAAGFEESIRLSAFPKAALILSGGLSSLKGEDDGRDGNVRGYLLRMISN